MARTGVTYTEVAKVAVELEGQGKNPTIENVRQLLGTGSHTTIRLHLNEWRAQQRQ
ncbi:MAG: DNA-binding protein, partial [Gammaproteobacteria bacterium]